ncbi:anoctamin-10-like [Babylonia areolata]|uniref:anoctamin-10-like n=1 Tax=Babylonia areolata TaxID=304850 RepID=UPI003FCF819F
MDNLHRRNGAEHFTTDNSETPNGHPSQRFEPLVVMEFSASAKQEAVDWMLQKLRAPKAEGGADLLVHRLYLQHNQETVVLVGAGQDRLLLAAEMQEMKKMHTDGFHREVNVQDIESFIGSGDLSSFFSQAEKQKLALREIEVIRATEMDVCVPGYDAIKLYPGKSIIKKLQSQEVVKQLFPLHEEEDLKRLGDQWYQPHRFLSLQPIHGIQQYFGEKVGLYFAFLGLYTVSLIPPALIGIVYFLTSWRSVYREAVFAIFNLVWSTLFLEGWKRYCSELAYTWGTIDTATSRFEEPRAGYHGTMGTNPVTRKPEPVYPAWKRAVRFYAVTVPVVGACLGVALAIMLLYFELQGWADGAYEGGEKGWGSFLLLYAPTAVYALLIGLLNGVYRRVAKLLNDFENHRTDSSYENHLVMKLILFDFVNSFICLFYVAFYLQDRVLLKSFLSTVLVTQQVVGQVREALVPFLFLRRRSRRLEAALQQRTVLDLQPEGATGSAAAAASPPGVVDSAVKRQVVVESTMEEYEGTMDDYLELFLQFGYVYLFSSAFPLAALWALLNNVTEIRSDAFKLCRVFRRPFAESASSIGAWQVAFEVIGVISVLTNCALIGMDPEVQKLLPSDVTAVNMVLVFVAVEHCVLGIKVAVAYFIDDTPHWVQVSMARMEHVSRQALQKERLAASNRRKQLLRKAFCRPGKSAVL